MKTKNCDIAVIGGGPAGLAAAQTAALHGASVVLIDDATSLGGHFYKKNPLKFDNPSTRRHQKKLQELIQREQALTQSGVEALLGTRVWGIFDETRTTLSKQAGGQAIAFHLHLDNSSAGVAVVKARSLILSPGVYDRPFPFPGWELPGVLTPGAAQIQLEKQGLLPGQRVLVAGSGPLQLVVASELARHGVDVAAILDTSNVLDGFLELPNALGGLFSRVGEALESMSILVRKRVPVLFQHAVYRALGTPETGVQGVIIGKVNRQGRPIPGTQRELQVDSICHAHGFIPSIPLTLHLGCNHMYDPFLNAFVPKHNENLQTSVPGVFVAGDVTGVGGKPLADLQGQLAAITALEQLNIISNEQANIKRKRLAPAVHREQRFSKWLWKRYRIQPGLLDLIDNDTLLCRCEAVRVGQFRESIEEGGQNLFGVKLRTRLGMGQCQGRYCMPNAALLIAAYNGKATPALDIPSIRPPLFPVRLKDIDMAEQIVTENE
ncbi:MAG: FAD-dependent oxidoreductase [Chloroflexota bacterium]